MGGAGARDGAGVPTSHATPPAPGRPLRMRIPRPQPWGLCLLPLLLLLPPQTLRAGEGRSAGRRAGWGRPWEKSGRSKNPNFPRASTSSFAAFLRFVITFSSFARCAWEAPVPLSLRPPPLSGSVPSFWGGVRSPSVLSLLFPASVLSVPSPLCLSGRQLPLPPVPLNLRVVPAPGDPRLLGVRLAGSTAVPELQ